MIIIAFGSPYPPRLGIQGRLPEPAPEDAQEAMAYMTVVARGNCPWCDAPYEPCQRCRGHAVMYHQQGCEGARMIADYFDEPVRPWYG